MQNDFYGSFDLERFPECAIQECEYRTAFQIERDRIIFSYPFRRLQSKTQVFQSGEYDFYRTRLTHSIEVAKVGRSICEYLEAQSEHLAPTFRIDPDLTEAICLAHDLGHPPFGHIGERKLNTLMAGYGGFEGNGQTLRILTELIYERPGHTKGISPTRSFLDGVMKYKATQSEWISATGTPPKHHFIYNDQASWRSQVFGTKEIPGSLESPKTLNAFKSIECQIMDWADDTAYSLHDIVDGIHARYISVGSLTEWAAIQELSQDESAWIDKLCDKIKNNTYEPYFGGRVGAFVHACTLKPRSSFLAQQTNRHAFDLKIDKAIQAESRLYKRIALDLIFKSTQLQQIEFKGGYILERLFQALAEHCVTKHSSEGLHLLPKPIRELLKHESDTAGRHRRLCDYVAGLTDGLAIRTYKRLFDADFGSISELQ